VISWFQTLLSYGSTCAATARLRALTYRITKQLYDNLPPSDPKWHYRTCAVVGNSGSLLLGAHGGAVYKVESTLT
jgi:hypothetical protein